MHKYLKVALIISVVVIPLLNILATSSRPHWSIGGEICFLPMAVLVAGVLVKKE